VVIIDCHCHAVVIVIGCAIFVIIFCRRRRRISKSETIVAHRARVEHEVPYHYPEAAHSTWRRIVVFCSVRRRRRRRRTRISPVRGAKTRHRSSSSTVTCVRVVVVDDAKKVKNVVAHHARVEHEVLYHGPAEVTWHFCVSFTIKERSSAVCGRCCVVVG